MGLPSSLPNRRPPHKYSRRIGTKRTGASSGMPLIIAIVRRVASGPARPRCRGGAARLISIEAPNRSLRYSPLPHSPVRVSLVTRQPDEDLFDHTKMTFGEHLDELRGALIKSVAALMFGFLVALAFSGWLIDRVQAPLKQALTHFYINMAKQEYLEHLKQERDAGTAVPADLDAAA